MRKYRRYLEKSLILKSKDSGLERFPLPKSRTRNDPFPVQILGFKVELRVA